MKLPSIILQFLCWWLTIQVVFSFYNVALYKPAWQSSVSYDRIPNRGNDGNIKTFVKGIMCTTETLIDNPAWWMVDLKGQYVTEQIVLTNRNDDTAYAHRLRNFQIDVFQTDPRQLDNFLNISGDVCFNRTDPVDGGTFTWKCTTPVNGRYVRLIRYAEDNLNINELKVMVSRELLTFSSFTIHLDSMLDIPFIMSVYASSPNECVQLCLQLRSKSRCTAVNWLTSNKECQLLSIDARQRNSILSNLTTFEGASLYMESD